MKFYLYRWALLLFTFTMLGCATTAPSAPKPVERPKPTAPALSESGKASYYADEHASQKTASGELYNPNLKTAAHRTLPFGSKLKVTNLANGKSVDVTVNDRGPHVKGRVVDLSKSAFSSISSLSAGVIRVQIVQIE